MSGNLENERGPNGRSCDEIDPQGGKPASANRRMSPVMPIVVGTEKDVDFDPYGFGLPYREFISKFVEEHERKFQIQASDTCHSTL